MLSGKRRMFAREVKRERKIASTDALPTAPPMVLAISRTIVEQIFMKFEESVMGFWFNYDILRSFFASTTFAIDKSTIIWRRRIFSRCWVSSLQWIGGQAYYKISRLGQDDFSLLVCCLDVGGNFSVHLLAAARGRSQHWQFTVLMRKPIFYFSFIVFIVSTVYASLEIQLAIYLSPNQCNWYVSHKMRFWSLVRFIDCIVNRDAIDLPSIESRRSNRIINEPIDQQIWNVSIEHVSNNELRPKERGATHNLLI